MQTTFILKNITESALSALSAMSALEAHDQLTRWAFGDLRHCVSVKYGPSDAFRDRVEWNGIIKLARDGRASLAFKIAPRRGYKLATFEGA